MADTADTVDTAGDVAALQAALAARARLQGWSAGAELVALVRAAEAGGWLDALAGHTTTEALAALGGVTIRRARDVIDVLVSAGVAETAEDGSPRLAPEFAALHAGASGVTLPVVLDALDADRARLREALAPSQPGRSTVADALVVARSWALLPTAAAGVVFDTAYSALPAYRDRLASGGRLLDVGSGLGGALLTTLTLFPRLHAVGVEHAKDVAAELAERARAAGVIDRLEVCWLAAEKLDADAAFEACYWAQAFFAPDTRAPTLAAIRRALVPGGALLVQELTPPPLDDPTARTRADLDVLVADTRDALPDRSAEHLAAELTTAGFTDAEITVTPLGRLVLAHTPR